MSEGAGRLFSYGTLQLPEVQQATFGRLLCGAPDALVGFAQEMMEITDRDVLATSGQRFHPIVKRRSNPAHRVDGMVFEITAAELASADAYEVDDYERVEAQLASGLKAWVYVQRA
ncbi:MAG: gamma-glutamylcyclotransferase family protein [Terricaulis sp.]